MYLLHVNYFSLWIWRHVLYSESQCYTQFFSENHNLFVQQIFGSLEVLTVFNKSKITAIISGPTVNSSSWWRHDIYFSRQNGTIPDARGKLNITVISPLKLHPDPSEYWAKIPINLLQYFTWSINKLRLNGVISGSGRICPTSFKTC